MNGRWAVKTKDVRLPCGHIQKRISNPERPNVRVRRGDIGICLACGEWWECIGLSDERIKYTPTKEEIDRMLRALKASEF